MTLSNNQTGDKRMKCDNCKKPLSVPQWAKSLENENEGFDEGGFCKKCGQHETQEFLDAL